MDKKILEQMENAFKMSEYSEPSYIDVEEGDNIGKIINVAPFKSQKNKWFIKIDVENEKGIMSCFLGEINSSEGTISYIDRFNDLCIKLGVFARNDKNKPSIEDCFKALKGLEVNLFGTRSKKPDAQGNYRVFGNIKPLK